MRDVTFSPFLNLPPAITILSAVKFQDNVTSSPGAVTVAEEIKSGKVVVELGGLALVLPAPVVLVGLTAFCECEVEGARMVRDKTSNGIMDLMEGTPKGT